MKEDNEICTCAGPLKVISLRKFFKKLNTEKMYEMGNSTSYEKGPHYQDNEDAVYNRESRLVEPATYKHFKKQLLKEFKVEDYSDNVVDIANAVELAAIECLNNFGSPNYLVDLGHDKWGVFSDKKDNIAIRRCSPKIKKNPGMGVLLVYKPTFNRVFKYKGSKASFATLKAERDDYLAKVQ